jgi:type 1 fimbria pilin
MMKTPLLKFSIRFFLMYLFLLTGLLCCSTTYATCYLISYTGTRNTTDPYYIDPKTGTNASWSGATDTMGTAAGAPAKITLSSLAFQPGGSLIWSGTDSFYNMMTPSFTPDQVLFRCTADEEGKLYEYYATNGDNGYSGEYADGQNDGIAEAYATYFKGLLIRVTNLTTGEYYSRYWKARALTNLDKDSQGWLLVKAKNFSQGVKIELFRTSNYSHYYLYYSHSYDYSQPAAYVAFKGGGIGNNLSPGADSLNHYDGWYSDWPGAVNLYNHIYVTYSDTCVVDNVTPNIMFPTISQAELASGGTRSATVSVRFNCETATPESGVSAFKSGTSAGQTAMGLLPEPGNVSAAVAEGFGTAGGGVSYLLPDGYKADPNVATGVGIQLANSSGTPLTLLGQLGNFGTGATAGWYPVLDNSNLINTTSSLSYYQKDFTATLKRLPGKTVTSGKISAKLNVIIQVQ